MGPFVQSHWAILDVANAAGPASPVLLDGVANTIPLLTTVPAASSGVRPVRRPAVRVFNADEWLCHLGQLTSADRALFLFVGAWTGPSPAGTNLSISSTRVGRQSTMAPRRAPSYTGLAIGQAAGQTYLYAWPDFSQGTIDVFKQPVFSSSPIQAPFKRIMN